MLRENRFHIHLSEPNSTTAAKAKRTSALTQYCKHSSLRNSKGSQQQEFATAKISDLLHDDGHAAGEEQTVAQKIAEQLYAVFNLLVQHCEHLCIRLW